MKLRLKILVSIIFVVTVSLLLIQNTLLLAISSEISDIDEESNGEAVSARYVQIPPTLSSLHPQRRDLHLERKPPNTLFPPQALNHQKFPSVGANLTSNRRRTVSNSSKLYTSTYSTASNSTTKSDAAIRTPKASTNTLPPKNTTKKRFLSYNDIRERIKQRNQAKKTENIPKPPDYNYENWDEMWKSDNDVDYPFYSRDSSTTLTPVPPKIAALFPTNFSNTTLLIYPPKKSFVFKKPHRDIFTHSGVDIFELLSRWNKTDVSFYNKLDRLKIDIKDPPVPRWVFYPSPFRFSISCVAL